MTDSWVVSAGGRSVELFERMDRPIFLAEAPAISYGVDANTYTLNGIDGHIPGVDSLEGMTVLFSLTMGDLRSETESRRILGNLRSVWRAPGVRKTPGAVGTLTAPSGRLTFGRPQRYDPGLEYQKVGLITGTVDFAATTDLWFSPEVYETSVSIVPPPGGGLIAPLAAPLTTTASSNRSTGFTVGGDEATWGRYEIVGPITNPVLEIVGLFRFEYSGVLAYDESLVIDTNPHLLSVTRNGAAVALTTTSTPFEDTELAPGDYELVLRGISEGGTAKAFARWREAFTTY